MAKTEVILTHNVPGLGAESDHVKVAAGYARNYLFPQGLAIPLTGANKRRLDVLRQRRAEREAQEFNTMSELARSISKLTAVVAVKTGDDGKMFGSVTSAQIAEQLQTQFDIQLDRRKIHLHEPIRSVGEHDVELRLHHDVNASLKVRVESTTPLPEKTEAPGGQAKGKGRGGRGRSDRPERAWKADKADKAEGAESRPKRGLGQKKPG